MKLLHNKQLHIVQNNYRNMDNCDWHNVSKQVLQLGHFEPGAHPESPQISFTGDRKSSGDDHNEVQLWRLFFVYKNTS